MKHLTLFLTLLFLNTNILSAQSLDYSFGVVDFNTEVYDQSKIRHTIKANGFIYFVASIAGYNKDEIYKFDGSTYELITQADHSLIYVEQIEAGIFFRDNIYSTEYLYFFNFSTGSITSLIFLDENIQGVFVRENRLFFGDQISDKMYESDGTVDGTMVLMDFFSLRIEDTLLAYNDDYFFFGANDQLWRSDGSITGTIPLFDEPNIKGRDLYKVENKFYYRKDYDEIIVTDGTLVGTHSIFDSNSPYFSDSKIMGSSGDRMIFMGRTQESGKELWATEGPASSTELVLEIGPGNYSGVQPENTIKSVGKGVFFNGGPTFGSNDIWYTDGTAEHTYMIKELPATNLHISDVYLLGNGTQIFTTSTSTYNTLWTYDENINQLDSLLKLNSASANISGLVSENRIFSRTWHPITQQEGLIISDGTLDGTTVLDSLSMHYNLSRRWIIDDLLLFLADSLNGINMHNVPFISDGTETGTVPLRDYNLYSNINHYITEFFEFNEEYYFVGSDDSLGIQLFKTDATPEGTISLIDFFDFTQGEHISRLTEAGGKLYYQRDFRLHASDGTVDGTVAFEYYLPSSNAYKPYKAELNNRLIFNTTDNLIISTDGTLEGIDTLLTDTDGLSNNSRTPFINQ